MLRRILALAVVFLLAILPTRAARVGIIAVPELQPPADLLTAALSQKENVQIVERAQLERITSERGLTVANSPEAGRLLGADGLVFLELAGAGTNRNATVRFVAIKQGIVLFSARLGWPPVELERWTGWLADRVSEAAVKSTVPSEKTVKLSILNLRSAVTSPAQRLLERELTALLLFRLQQEPNVIVLELRQLNAAAFEKELAESEEKFWTGGSLLDGTIDRDRVDPKRVQLSLRLRAADGAETPINAEGPRDQLGEVIEQVVGKILEALKAEKLAAWDPSREAAQHLQEAAWALRWGLWKEAQASSDAAWALGSRSMDAAATRMLAYARENYGKSSNMESWRKDMFSGVRYPSIPPGPEVAESLFESVALLNDYLVSNPGAVTNDVWWLAARETLDSAGTKLNLFFTRAESRDAAEPKLTESRSLCRSIVETFLADPVIRKEYWVEDNDPHSLERREQPLEMYLNFFRVLARHAHLFFEKPEETAALYRQLMTGDLFPTIRMQLFRDGDYYAPLGGWRWEDRKREWIEREKLADYLYSSTNALIRLEGWVMRLAMIPTSNEYNPRDPIATRARAELEDFFEQNRETLLNAKVSRRFSSFLGPQHGRLAMVFRNSWKMDNEISKSFEQRKTVADVDSVAADFKKLVAERRPFEMRSFSKVLHQKFSPEQAAELLALAAEYQREVVDKSSPREQLRSRNFLKMIESRLRSQTNTARVESGPTEPAAIKPPRIAPPGGVGPRPPKDPVFKGAIQVHQYWRAPFTVREDTGKPFSNQSYISQPKLRNGSLWLRIYHDSDFVNGRFIAKSGILKLSADTFDTLADIPTGEAPIPGRVFSAGIAESTFDIDGSKLVVVSGEHLLMGTEKAVEWRKFDLPAQNSQLWRLADSLYLLSPDSLQRLDPQSGQTALLASVRRRPALNALDELATLTNAVIGLGPENSLRIVAHGSVFRFSNGQFAKEFTLQGATWFVSSGHLLAIENRPNFRGFHVLESSKEKLERVGQLTMDQAEGMPFILGQNPAVISLGAIRMNERLQKGETLNRYELIVFTQPDGHPTRVSLELDLAKGPNLLTPPFFKLSPYIAVTEKYLIIGNHERDGFWRVERSKIEEVLQR